MVGRAFSSTICIKRSDFAVKRIALSSPAIRASCAAADLLLAGFAALWLIFAFSWLAVLVALCALALACFYTIQAFRSAILVFPEEKAVVLTGLQARRDDLSDAARVFTREARAGQQTTRVIVVEDGAGKELSVISTLNTLNHGYACETAARQLAEALGVSFLPTVPAHLYDRQARNEYQRRQQEQEREARRRKRARHKRDSAAQPDQSNVPPPTVNYDEQDDEPE